MQSGVGFPVPDLVRRRALAEGPDGHAWLADLDAVLSSLEQDWSITIGQALPGGSAAFVAQAIDTTGVVSIIKLSTPATGADRNEAAVLAAANGKGYARLLRHDAFRHAMLLEQLGPSLATLDLPFRAKIDIMCDTLLDAWMPVQRAIPSVTGAEKANSLAQSILTLWHHLGQPAAQPVLDTALMYCRDRAAAWRPENAVLCHGDPHPDNTLQAAGQTFKFVDPDGLAIEPAYDLGVLLRGWHESLDGRHPHDMARSYARHLTTRTQVPAEPIWQWGYIERVSTGLHLMELGELEEGQTFLRTAQAILPPG